MIARPRSIACLAILLLSSLPSGCGDEGPEEGTPIEEDSEGMGDEVPVCIEQCDPVEQDCSPGMACLPDQPGFSCQGLTASTDGVRRGLHDPCEAGSQTCDAGLVCLPVAAPGCTGSSGCCVAICETTRSECTEGTQCHPFFGAEAMCYPEVGACAL